MRDSKIYYSEAPSPWGRLRLLSDGECVTELSFPQRDQSATPAEGQRDEGCFHLAKEQLRAYFAGELREFTVPLRMIGTDFQRRVWTHLQRIPFGETWSYGELATRMGRPTASRAVGAANGRNPIAIIVPCHRVIGANGQLTGFGGGLDRKDWLLRHEADARRRVDIAMGSWSQHG